MRKMAPSLALAFAIAISTAAISIAEPIRVAATVKGLLSTEKIAGEEVWMQPIIAQLKGRAQRLRVKVWFEEQFLGDGKAYRRRAAEFDGRKRGELRLATTKTLKALSDKSYAAAKEGLEKLIADEKIREFERHWIINGFTCVVDYDALDDLKAVNGVKNIFVSLRGVPRPSPGGESPTFKPVPRAEFDPARYKHPWYIHYLQADRVWKEFGVAGTGTLNIVHDFNFVYSDNVSYNAFRNTGETPGNMKDDDGNGLIDDYHGFNFDRGSSVLKTATGHNLTPQTMHGYMCAAIICGAGAEGKPYEFGIAPEGRWAGVIASGKLEQAIEWAIEQNADTYSMSFSIPGLGDYRSHWRKLMEHGSFCGIYFVSGAGNFAQNQSVPIQMRTPEDIPDVVFAAAGVQRGFGRTPFSSKGHVQWNTEHYQDGKVAKPEVCAFNMGLPLLLPDGSVRPVAINGNSFAGPMFCGSIALMVSADPDLLPWHLKEIITSTATDVAALGVDDETGHGLINCYRAVKEVLRRKAVREGTDAKPYTGREKGDEIDIDEIKRKLASTKFVVAGVQPNGQADKLGIKADDVFLSYNDVKISNQLEMQAAKRKASDAELKKIKVVIERAGKELTFEMTPGALGIIPSVQYDDPTFQ
jgi:hypothetical protein